MTEPSGEFKESQKVFIAQGMIREVRKWYLMRKWPKNGNLDEVAKLEVLVKL